MPVEPFVSSKYSQKIIANLKNQLISEIFSSQYITRSGYSEIFFKKYKITRSEFNHFLEHSKNLDWLTHQEINSIIEYSEDIDERVKFLFHRFRYSLMPSLRIATTIPPYVLIEPTSICNMRCPMCFQSDKTFTSKEYMGKIDFKLFKKIIDECYELGVGAITLASRGEPTLHPQLGEMIKYLNGKIMEVKLNSNAMRLTPDLSNIILSSDISHIVFSIDSHDEKEYESIRVGGVFKQVFKNVSNFWELRNSSKFKSKKIRVSISGLKVKDTQDPIAFREFWGKYSDDAYLNPPEERWDTYFNEKQPELTTSCIYPWERMYIWHDGTVNPCDVDYKSFLSPGNYMKLGSISKCWSELNKLRALHLTENRNLINPCDRCGVFHSFKK